MVLMVAGMFVLALAGVGLLVATLWAVLRDRGPAAPAPSPTALALLTEAVVIPTTTPAPSDTPTPPASNTPRLPTDTPTPEFSPTPAGFRVTASVGINVRAGPGTNYDIVGGLAGGASALAVARDPASTWVMIQLEAAPGGTGWVLIDLVQLEGDVASLPAATPAAAPAAPPASGGGNQQPAATARPTNTQAAPPPASSRGITGNLTLCEGRTTYSVGERVCFRESIKNTTAQTISYGILGVQAANTSGGAQFQTSWSGAGQTGGLLYVDAGCEGPLNRCGGPWEDGVRLSTAGTYRLALAICYSDFDTCSGGGGQWETLTAPITIQVN